MGNKTKSITEMTSLKDRIELGRLLMLIIYKSS